MLGAPVTSASPYPGSPDGGNSGAASCAGVGAASGLANDVSEAELASRECCGEGEGDLRPTAPRALPREVQSLGAAESSLRRGRGIALLPDSMTAGATLERCSSSTSATIWSDRTSVGSSAPAAARSVADGPLAPANGELPLL